MDTVRLFEQAFALHRAGQLDEAERLYREALRAAPKTPDALHLLGVLRTQRGAAREGEELIRRAIALNSSQPRFHNNLGKALSESGRWAEAVESHRQAVQMDPNYLEGHYNLGVALQQLGQLDSALQAYRRAIDLQPGYGLARHNFADLLTFYGRFREAADIYRQLLEAGNEDVRIHQNLLSALMYDPITTEAEKWAAHESFGRKMAARVTTGKSALSNAREPQRRIHLGYVSSDFRDHPVARNLMPILAHRDRERFEVTAYVEVARPDATTEKLKGMVDRWRPTVGMSDGQLVEQIRADGIDVLVLLGGHFDHNRPQIASWRAAPVQVSFHDSLTSGIAEMDYLIADRVLAPRGTDEQFSERVVRLPSFYIHAPLTEAPDAGPLPARANGHVTFGSFNNPAKVNDAVLKLWGEVLRAMPASRLILKYKNWFGNKGLRERVLKGLGVGEEFVEFRVGKSDAEEHLALYRSIDIALDPFPFTGSTTTFEALWMGVPVVTLLGRAMAGRWSGSMLHTLKLDELVARTPDEYVAIAARLAGDGEKLVSLRRDLRNRMASSPLCDGRARARQVGRLYRALWRRWCKIP